MNLTIRLVCFFIILLISYLADRHPPKIGSKAPTPLRKGLITSFLVTLAALSGTAMFWLFYQGVGTFGNQVVVLPVLIGMFSFIAAIFVSLIFKRYLPQEMRQTLLVLPVILNLALATTLMSGSNSFWYEYLIGLSFFLVVALLFMGIKDRIAIAPIPSFLNGLPIQLTILFLIFLNLSFFGGVFFEELF